MSNYLTYIPLKELERLRKIKVDNQIRVSLFANACRVNTLSMIMESGSGHPGSSLSCMDLICWLYLVTMKGVGDKNGDLFFSSKGHDVPGLYSVMIGLGLIPYEKVHQLRKIDGLPGHPDIKTPHIITNTGSLGMGISKAKGFVRASRLTKTKKKIYVLLGDGELQEGQIWESLLQASHEKMSEITAIVDHNKLQSDTLVEEVSSLGNLESRFESHGWYVKRCDGHDFQQILSCMNDFELIEDRPQLLIADTIKAKGGGVMESVHFDASNRLYKFHSGAPDNEVYQKAISELLESTNLKLNSEGEIELETEQIEIKKVDKPSVKPPERFISAYSKSLINQGILNKEIVVLSGDLALDNGLLEFENFFPERFFECGIAEQDMVSQAGTLGLRGMKPLVHSFACFLTQRACEQIYNNATEQTHIVYVGSLAGLLPGMPGHSHQSVRDIALLSHIPGMLMIEPCCEAEVEKALDFLINLHNGPAYLRLVSVPLELPYTLPDDYRLQLGRGLVLKDGTDLLLLAYSAPLLKELWDVSNKLEQKHGLSCKLVHMPFLKTIDKIWFSQLVEEFSHIITVDNHYLVGGVGQFVGNLIAGMESNPRIINLGIQSIPECGSHKEVLEAHSLDSDSIVNEILNFLGRN